MSRNRFPGVYKRGKTWSYRAQFGDGTDRTSVSGGGYASARDAYEARVKAIAEARPMRGITQRPDASLTLGSYLDAWVADHTRHLRPGTAAAYRARALSIQQSPVTRRRLRGLTEGDYRQLVDDMRAGTESTTYLRQKLVLLRAALNDAVAAGLIPSHPLDRIKVSRTEERFQAKVWDVPTVRKFLSHRRRAGDPLYLAWHLAIVTGLRRGELHGLRWEDVDLDRAVLHVRRQRLDISGTVIEQAPKTSASEASIALDPETVELLASAPRTSDYVVNDPRTGRPYASLRTFLRDFKRATDNAGVPEIRFHDLRHTSASLLAHAGVPLPAAKQRMRHWSQAMTEHYTHALDGADVQVAHQIGGLVSGA